MSANGGSKAAAKKAVILAADAMRVSAAYRLLHRGRIVVAHPGGALKPHGQLRERLVLVFLRMDPQVAETRSAGPARLTGRATGS